MDDDLMPSDGTYFAGREPQGQVKARRKEKAETLQALPVLRDLLKRLNERIAFYEKTTSIPDDVKMDEKKFMATVNSYALAAENLISEREWIEGLIEETK